MSELRDSLLGALECAYEDVEVRGQVVRVKGMSAAEAVRFSVELGEDASESNILRQLLVRTIVDPETNERVFADSDGDLLMSRSGADMGRLAMVARRLSGLGDLEDSKNG